MHSPVSHENSSCNRVNLIIYLFGSDPILGQFFFNEDETELNFKDRLTTLRMAARHLDVSQYILVRLALDIWLGGTPRTKALEIPTYLMGHQIENLTTAFCVMNALKGCGCQTCGQRFEAQGLCSSFANHRDR
jgi:hypothetical protein